MAVLVEAISVIVRRDAIAANFNGGWDAFRKVVPNGTLCTDGELARVGFMTPADVEQFLDILEQEGLCTIDDGKFFDVAVVDQQNGPTLPTTWIEFGRLPINNCGNRVSACWLFEGPRLAHGMHMKGLELDLTCPVGWDYENSLSSQYMFIANEEMESGMKFLRHEDQQDIYLDPSTGKEIYVARPSFSINVDK